MSLSFWINVAICLITLYGAWLDHGETFAAFKSLSGAERRRKGQKLLILWGIPILSLFMLPFTARESIASNREIGELRSEISVQTNNVASLQAKVTDTESKTPSKMRVSSVSASAEFLIGTNCVATNRWGNAQAGWTALLSFMGPETNISAGSSLALNMVSDELIWWGPAENLRIPLQFRLKPGQDYFPRTALDRPAEELLSKLHFFSLRPAFLYSNTEILGGSVTLVLNGSVSKTFRIEPQPFCWLRTNSMTGQLESHSDIRNY